MEAFEAAKIVYNRILETESETITRKIIGYIYLQDHADREMIRLAFGPDNLIQNLIQKAKIELNFVAKPPHSLQFGPILHSHRPFSAPSALQIPSPTAAPHWDSPLHYPNMVLDDCRYQNHEPFIGLGDQFEPFNREITSFTRDCYSPDGNFSVRGRRDGIQTKICHYFSKGHCKHGNKCKFLHTEFNPNELLVDDQVPFSPGSLEKLEFEITEILKARRGNPISIASLPMIYYERYGRTLQAEGYLTESQRHGKAGYSLTRLLARLKNSIRLIDSCRPHGQHFLVLAGDASRYMENRYERTNSSPGPIVSGSKQIYLTFPAESTFTEDDAANYFSTYGPVQDVRIPCQQKRMFGFVTFHNSETVQMVLAKGNPHYVCGARVLVKPYREKIKFIERKYFEKIDGPMCYNSHHIDMDPDLQARFDSSRLFGSQLMEEPEVAVQLEMMRLSQLHLAREPSYLDTTFEDQTLSQDQVDNSKFQSPNFATHLLDHAGTNYTDHDNESNQSLNLPDSPFACNKGSNRQI